jgi:uncharacterized protein YqeY
MIYQQIQQDRMKKGADRTRLAVIMSEITVDGKPMSDSDAIEKLTQMRKSVSNNIVIYKKANKIKQLDGEEKYLIYINKYLPPAATADDIIAVIEENGIEKNIKSMKDVMQILKKNFDVVDGGLVRQILLK